MAPAPACLSSSASSAFSSSKVSTTLDTREFLLARDQVSLRASQDGRCRGERMSARLVLLDLVDATSCPPRLPRQLGREQRVSQRDSLLSDSFIAEMPAGADRRPDSGSEHTFAGAAWSSLDSKWPPRFAHGGGATFWRRRKPSESSRSGHLIDQNNSSRSPAALEALKELSSAVVVAFALAS